MKRSPLSLSHVSKSFAGKSAVEDVSFKINPGEIVGFLGPNGVPEERGLYKKQTAREAIAHLARLNGMKGKDAFRRADEMLDKYGLSEAKRKKNKDMSKGMAQKVQLLAAIAHSPEFYILDEPFSGLDPVNQQVLESIVREISQGGNTIIFSTHVMEHAERLCDRIVETITPMAEELMRREDGAFAVTLTAKAETHSLLEACVNGGIKLSRIDDRRP